MITHVVLMKFDPAVPDAAEVATRRLESLVGAVPSLRSLHVGRNVVDGPGAHDLVLTTTFDSLDGLADYQAHPAHQEVLGWLRQVLVSRAVVDYEA